MSQVCQYRMGTGALFSLDGARQKGKKVDKIFFIFLFSHCQVYEEEDETFCYPSLQVVSPIPHNTQPLHAKKP